MNRILSAHTLSILSWNIHGNADTIEGPKNENPDVLDYLCRHHVFCLQETKMEISVPNYRCYNKNRKTSRSGGVCIGVHRSLEKCTKELKTPCSDIQAIMLRRVIKNPMRDLIIISIYDSPPSSSYKRDGVPVNVIKKILWTIYCAS